MRDLSAINGPWQAITFLNFYKSEYEENNFPSCTVIFYEIDDELKDVCKLILSGYSFVEKILDFSQIDSLNEKLYSNIWIGKLFSIHSKNIVEKFSRLPIILFEEGLHSYINQKSFNLIKVFNESYSIEIKLKIVYKYYFKRNLLIKQFSDCILPFHQKRCKKKYFLLPILDYEKPKSTVNNKYIYSVINDAISVLKPENIFVVDKPCVLIIGQYFSNLGLLGFELENNVYYKIINYYLNKGYNVYWKGHPRCKFFDERINAEFGERVYIVENNSIPLELFLILNPKVEICGVSSSALLYNKFLFNGKTKHSLSLIKNHLNEKCVWYNDFMKIFSLIENNIEGIDV